MSAWRLTRRAFLGLAASLGVVTTVGCPPPQGGVIRFKRSGRGGHVSNAAKAHNANRLYATRLAATLDLAHPGDRSKVVQVTISQTLNQQLFGNGQLIADLRREL